MKGFRGRVAAGALLLIVAVAVVGWLYLVRGTPASEEGRWDGVDVKVIEKYAAGAGITPAGPLIDMGQGDLLLFVFALGGAVAGFTAGYYWRQLVSEKSHRD